MLQKKHCLSSGILLLFRCNRHILFLFCCRSVRFWCSFFLLHILLLFLLTWKKVIMDTNLAFNLIADVRMLFQEQLGILSSLADLISFVCIPCTALIHNGILSSKIKDIPFLGDAGTKHNIKLSLLKWRSNLILNNLDPGVVSNHLAALFQCLYTAYIKTYG